MAMNSEAKHTLTQARDEILMLRRTNEILGAKVEVMELFAASSIRRLRGPAGA